MTPSRGAPPGNKNALKHGFYSRGLPKSDLQDLQSVDTKGLGDEIGLLRLQIRDLYLHARNAPTLEEYLDINRVINLCLSNLNRLVKTQAFIKQDAPGLDSQLEKVLAEAQATWPQYGLSETGDAN